MCYYYIRFGDDFLGAIVNFFSIIIGSATGLVLKRGLPERFERALLNGMALCVMLVGISGALKGENTLIAIISIAIGAVIGELIDIDGFINKFAKGIEDRLSSGGKDVRFAKGFVSATLLFGVGAMAIVGSLDSGLSGDNSTLYTKSLIDGITAIVFTANFGIGVIFSSIPILLYQGGITLLAAFVAPYLTATIINEMTCVGSLLIIALSLNMLKICNIKVANYIPAVFIPIILCQFM